MKKLKKWWWMIGIIILSSVVGISSAFFYNQSSNKSNIVFNQIKEIRQIGKQQDDDYTDEIHRDWLEKIIYVNPMDCLVGGLLDYEIVTVGNYQNSSQLNNITIFIFEEKNNTEKPYIEIDIHSRHWSKHSVNMKENIYKSKKINVTNINNTEIVFGEYKNKTNKEVQYTASLSFEDVEYYFISYQKLEKHIFVQYVLKWSENLNG